MSIPGDVWSEDDDFGDSEYVEVGLVQELGHSWVAGSFRRASETAVFTGQLLAFGLIGWEHVNGASIELGVATGARVSHLGRRWARASGIARSIS